MHYGDSSFVSFVLNDGPQNWCDESSGLLPKLEIVHKNSYREDLPLSYMEYRTLVEDEEAIYAGHKIGGVPFYERGDEDFVMEVISNMRDGYELILQIGFPNPEDEIADFDWSFCDMYFTLFARKGSEGYDFMCCWY